MSKGIVVALLTLAAVSVLLLSIGQFFEYNGAGDVLVVQHINGSLSVHTDPGYKWQGFGTVTHYRKSLQHWFSSKEDQGDARDQSIRVRFNDGGHANISGSVRVDIPVDQASLLDIHSTFGSQTALEQQLVRTVIEKAVYMTGPLMSSKESYAEKRNNMLNLIEDQASGGVYQTLVKETDVEDPLTGEKRRMAIVELRRDGAGRILRQEESPLTRFNVKIYNLSLNEIKYDETVEKQIDAQQEAIMNVQTAIANAKRAEQDAITVAKQGEASAASAKWEQEKINARLVAEAEGRKKAALLDKEAAEYERQRQILLGQGESERKRLLMEANNALDSKLDAYVRVNEAWARAFTEMKVPVVPSIIFGQGAANGTNGTNGPSNSSVQDLMNLLQAKTARDLSLDLSTVGKRPF
jgi:regulator of protease activity HflC (stomatin/prohibitin superfamily)